MNIILAAKTPRQQCPDPRRPPLLLTARVSQKSWSCFFKEIHYYGILLELWKEKLFPLFALQISSFLCNYKRKFFFYLLKQQAKVNSTRDGADTSTAPGLHWGIKLRPCQVLLKFHPKLTDLRKIRWNLALSITIFSISMIEASVCSKISTLAFQGAKYYYSHFTNEEISDLPQSLKTDKDWMGDPAASPAICSAPICLTAELLGYHQQNHYAIWVFSGPVRFFKEETDLYWKALALIVCSESQISFPFG